MTCPDDDTLAAISDLGDTERAAIVDHAATCESCRTVLQDLLGVKPAAFAEAETLAASGSSLPTPEMPSVIDRYRIERRIGAGAMGVVFAAHDPELARPVAVKVLRAGGSAERMRSEAQALAKLTHSNVVAVYDVGEHAGSTFVTMALVDGANLRTWLESKRTTAQIIDAITQAARGVDAAHRAGIVHRDIKPDNIFVARNGDVLVGDFGLARSGNETGDGTVAGTPAYMAPEQLDGEASAASDQFALCVTAWEALYGARPFTGKSIDELAAAVRAGPPPDPRTPKVPSHVRAAIRRGLAADPEARHASVAELIPALAPRRRRWPYVAIAGAIAATTIAVIALREDPEAAAIARCDALTGPAAWTAERRAEVLAKVGPPKAKPVVATVIATVVDRYTTEWTQLARTSCSAAARRELSEPVHATTKHCLDRRADTLAWLLHDLEIEPVELMGSVEYLEPVETCRSLVPVATSPGIDELQRDLDRAAVLASTAPAKALGLDLLVEAATKLGDPSLLAEGHYLAGVSLYSGSRDAEGELRQAIASAEKASDDRIRTRASALLAVVMAKKWKIADATAYRDAARSSLARSADPTTTVAVERANAAVAFAQRDFASQLAATRRIETIQLARFGDPSASLADTLFAISGAMNMLNDPGWVKVLDRAIAMLALFADGSPAMALEAAAIRERAPARRLVLEQQIVAIARRDEPTRLPDLLRGIGYTYELTDNWERVLAVNLEAVELAGAKSELRAELIENAGNAAMEIADQTDDPAIRTRRAEEAITHIDQLPPAARGADSAQAIRGRALLLLGRYLDAVPPLTAALAAAERADPPHPYRVAVRSFMLAQALWEVGGIRDRDRALALVEQAATRMPEARAMFAADEANGSAIDRLERQAARLEAWRRTHR